jgi:hypothetical protein
MRKKGYTPNIASFFYARTNIASFFNGAPNIASFFMARTLILHRFLVRGHKIHHRCCIIITRTPYFAILHRFL